MMREKTVEEIFEGMRFGYGQTHFFHQGFEVLLRRCLAMEADNVMQRRFSPAQAVCGHEIGFCFSYPGRGFSFHGEVSPSSRLLERRSRLRRAARPGVPACGRSG